MHKKQPEDNLTDNAPPKSDVNTILSSAGNGLTIGSVPIITAQFAHLLNKKYIIPRALEVGGVFASITGCAIGAIVGMQEAKEINRYRASLRADLKNLREQTEKNTQKMESWAEKAHPAEKAEEGMER